MGREFQFGDGKDLEMDGDDGCHVNGRNTTEVYIEKS